MEPRAHLLPGAAVVALIVFVWLLGTDRVLDTENPLVPVGEQSVEALDWTVENFRDVFQKVSSPVGTMLDAIESRLRDASPAVFLIVAGLASWQVRDLRLAAVVVGGFAAIAAIGGWDPAMTTLAIVVTSVLLCVLFGVPIGILAGKSRSAAAGLRPVLDLMQTTPSFVYLVPIVSLFGIGNVPGVIVTVIYAMPPVIRLTGLGIREVPADMVEASEAFGASQWQTLRKVQIPLATPTIMAGVNQTIMMSLAMVVVASMISVTGLGQMVLRGIGRLDMNIATVGGLGIVLLAVAVDRFSQALATTSRERNHVRWHESGPIGIIRSLIGQIRASRSRNGAGPNPAAQPLKVD